MAWPDKISIYSDCIDIPSESNDRNKIKVSENYRYNLYVGYASVTIQRCNNRKVISFFARNKIDRNCI